MLSSVWEKPLFYELFDTLLHGYSLEIITETPHTPIKRFV